MKLIEERTVGCITFRRYEISPEVQAAIAMALERGRAERREGYWRHVQRIAARVAQWSAWKRGPGGRNDV